MFCVQLHKGLAPECRRGHPGAKGIRDERPITPPRTPNVPHARITGIPLQQGHRTLAGPSLSRDALRPTALGCSNLGRFLKQFRRSGRIRDRLAMVAMEVIFSRIAQWTGGQLGRPYVFAAACVVVIVWAVTGPLFHYSDTWQLVINTGTTIITFLMVFLLQHTQNCDTQMIKLKLGELIRANEGARNALLGLEGLTDEEMRNLHERFAKLAKLGKALEGLEDAQDDLEKAREGVQHAHEHIARAVEKTRD
jgi:low affinity Fe/Cu permease